MLKTLRKLSPHEVVAARKMPLLNMGVTLLPKNLRDTNKYVPHQGKKEMERRKRQAAGGTKMQKVREEILP